MPIPAARGLAATVLQDPLNPLVNRPQLPVVVQVTTMLVTSAPPTVPEPLVTTQVCAGGLGSGRTVAEYVAPRRTGVAKVKLPFVDTVRLSPPLSWRTTESPVARPVTVPPTV